MKVLSIPPVSSGKSKNALPVAERYNEILYIVPLLFGIISLKLGLAFYVWHHGFLEYDTDGFTRSVSAWKWHNFSTKLEVDAWLPLQFWLNGWLMGIKPDLLLIPRLVNMVCSIGTTLNLFFVGRTLFGRLNGYLTALLVAFFPWEIWFGLSGMSESITNFFLTFGLLFFCIWLKTNYAKPAFLLFASLGFLGATMVRYEAWFYSAVFATIAFYFIWFYRAELRLNTRWQSVLALLPAFAFILFWMYLSWVDPRLKSPLGFAELTSGVNAKIYGAANTTASFWYRLVFYPQTFLNLLFQLTIPAIIGTGLLLFQPVRKVRPYLFLIWGEFGLFILTTLPYNNIAPGSARYPVSNLLLLLPVVVYLFQFVFKQPQQLVRYGVAFVFVLLLGSLILTTISRPLGFPDNNTRQVAEFLKTRWKEGYIQPNEKVFLILPPADGPQVEDYTRAFYALKVLTNHPDNFEVEADPAKFTPALQRSNGTAPHIWVKLASAGGSLEDLTQGYRETKTFGDYTVGDFPLYGQVLAEPLPQEPGKTFEFKATEYRQNETTSVWIIRPDGKVITVGNRSADALGIVSFKYTISSQEYLPGRWSIAVAGMETGRRSSTAFDVPAVPTNN